MFVLTFSWLQFQTLFFRSKSASSLEEGGPCNNYPIQGLHFMSNLELNCQMLYCNLCEVIVIPRRAQLYYTL